ncbi:MAG: rhomboid family intramembrane serine protease [Sphingobacteriales bacterium]|nr:rhomboid family intramembrane serine protease [Sphingobacteriales bacterium]
MLSITLILIIITAVVSLLAFSNQNLLQKFILYPYLMARKSGEWHRFISSGFLHGSLGHLLINMFVLFSFGSQVEQYFIQSFAYGKAAYIILYLSALVASSYPSYLRERNNTAYRALGASGAVAAILFSFILFDPLQGVYIMFIPIAIPAVIFGALYLGYEYYASRQDADGIGHDAHFFGAVYGLLFTIAVVPSVVPHFIGTIRSALG